MSEQERTLEFPSLRTGNVVVVGSLNEDLVISTIQAPRPGETLMARGHSSGLGGKGANQAVAARRMGASVEMVGTVGEDSVAADFLVFLGAEGVGTALIRQDPSESTGLAAIIVEESGENRILVSPGANRLTKIEQSGRSAQQLANADVVLAQLEVPAVSVVDAFEATQGVRVLNAAPAGPLSSELLSLVDILVVNETELAAVANVDIAARTLSEITAQAAQLETTAIIIVTRGSAGCVILSPGEAPRSIDAPRVNAVDTTGAGDCFCGTVAAELAFGRPIADAVALGVRAASISTTKVGAISGLPHRSEL